MQIAVIYLFWFAWVAFLCATVRYSTQMFQQNSYRIERYNRWLRSTGEWHSRANMVALVAWRHTSHNTGYCFCPWLCGCSQSQ